MPAVSRFIIVCAAVAVSACSSASGPEKSSDRDDDGSTTTADPPADTDSDAEDSGPTGSVEWCQSLEAEGWSEATHAKGVDGDYATVFAQDTLPRLDITICPDDYTAMQADLYDAMGEPGAGGRPPAGLGDFTPMYVPVTVAFDGRTWPYVGMRHKGNSSLMLAWLEGVEKLPFRLNFDYYEDDVSEVDNQRFHGFKELKYSSAFEDDSFIRDQITSDLFRAAGVPAAAGGLVAVYVDAGAGPMYWGVYAGFEDPAGELLDAWFGDDSGNAYKPDGETATLRDFAAADFEKKTNEDDEDWSDVRTFIETLNDDSLEGEAWRTAMETSFDMDAYLRYLAMNNLVGNWDSYGNMTHNYYLYGDPALDGRLVWIPWDFNEAMRTNGKAPLIPISLADLDSRWPMLARVAEDPVYKARYTEHLVELMEAVFTEDSVRTRAEALQDRIAAAVAEEAAPYTHLRSYGRFEEALDGSDGVVTRVTDARAEAEAFLAE